MGNVGGRRVGVSGDRRHNTPLTETSGLELAFTRRCGTVQRGACVYVRANVCPEAVWGHCVNLEVCCAFYRSRGCQ
jgi:hypothetical protein